MKTKSILYRIISYYKKLIILHLNDVLVSAHCLFLKTLFLRTRTVAKNKLFGRMTSGFFPKSLFCCQIKQKTKFLPQTVGPKYKFPGIRLSFQRASPSILSPFTRFTTKFGMGWCGSTQISTPERLTTCLSFPIGNERQVVSINKFCLCQKLCLLQQSLFNAKNKVFDTGNNFALKNHVFKMNRSKSIGLLVHLSSNHCWPFT